MIWLCFLFSTLIFSNLLFMATGELLSSFDNYLRFTNLSNIVCASPVSISATSTSLLLASSSSSSSSLSSSLFGATSFRSPHSYLRHSVTQALTEFTLQSTISQLITGKELNVSTSKLTYSSAVMSYSESASLLKSLLNSSSTMPSSSLLVCSIIPHLAK